MLIGAAEAFVSTLGRGARLQRPPSSRDELAHPFGALGARATSVDHPKAFGFGAREVQEGQSAGLVHGDFLLLEAVGRGTRVLGGAAGAGPCQPGPGRQIDQDRQVGHHAVDGDALECPDEARLQIACHALIDPGRIDEAVAKHDLAGRNRRPDHLLDVVAARRGEQDRLHPHAEFFGAAGQQHVAHGLRAGGAAGFARLHDLAPLGAQRLGQKADLRGLADALASFEGYEAPGPFVEPHLTMLPFRPIVAEPPRVNPVRDDR